MSFLNILKSYLEPAYDRDAVFGGDQGKTLTNNCSSCRWWTPDTPTVCEAFPEGIPLIILMGFIDHAMPYQNEDLVYEPSLASKIKKANVAKADGNYEELHPKYPAGSPDGKGGQYMPKGSPEYNAAIAKSHERFSAAKYVVGRSTNETPDDYVEKSEAQRKREGFLIAKSVLSKDTLDEYKQVAAATEKATKEEGDTASKFSTVNTETKTRTYTPERIKVHNEILDRLFKDAAQKKPKEGQKPDYILLGGVGGAGKSSFGSGDDKVYDEKTHFKLDNDAIKAEIPGYDSNKAFLYHVEAGDIMEKARQRAMAQGLNIVVDATMRKSVKKELEGAKANGYEPQVHFMHLSPKEAAGRAVSRWLNLEDGKPKLDKDGKVVRGRLVPPDVILGMTTNLKNFDEARKLVDTWSFRRNNVPRGAKPIIVLSKAKAKATS